MSDIETNSKLESENDHNTNSSNEQILTKINQWEEIKSLISKSMKEIFWKAWIKPLRFEKYEQGILYLSSDSKIISSRAETQYYETIFFQASIFFKPLKKIQFQIVPFEKKVNVTLKNRVQKININEQITYNDLSFIDSVSMKIFQ